PPTSDSATTPLLNFCGWVSVGGDGNILIFDDLYNSVVTVRNSPVLTQGNFARLTDLNCACVQGQVTQVPDPSGKLINAFSFVASVEDRGGACMTDPRLRDKPPPKQPDSLVDISRTHTYCGWVKVNSATRNVTIVDNRFNASLLASGYDAL